MSGTENESNCSSFGIAAVSQTGLFMCSLDPHSAIFVSNLAQTSLYFLAVLLILSVFAFFPYVILS